MSQPDLNKLDPEQLRSFAASLLERLNEQGEALSQRDEHVQRMEKRCHFLETLNSKLTAEMSVLKRHRFGKHSEQLNVLQRSLLDDVVDADIAAIELELKAATEPASPARQKQQPKRTALPPELPRTLIVHEPDSAQCQCGCQLKRIGEDVSEKLDYTPGEFTVERHIRGKWACGQCETLTQAPVPPHVIDKGIPTTGLLAQLLVAKYTDHLPLYRQEQIFGRAGLPIARSTLAEWVGRCGVELQPLADALRESILEHPVVHADETPVPILSPGKKKTHRAYIWAYCTTPFADTRAVVYDFTPSRAGEHARNFLGSWNGKLICDDYSGYKAGFGQGVTEIGCMAHARRKFFDLHAADKSTLATSALDYIGRLYEIERQAKELDDNQRYQLRQRKARPLLDAFHTWLLGSGKKYRTARQR